MTKAIAYVSGIYPYSRKHSLAARRFGRELITKEDLLKTKTEDSQLFIARQKDLGLDFISDGQFLWMDYARPFTLSNKKIEEEILEMVRKSDTNTFIRMPKIENLDDLMNTRLTDFMLPVETENRSIKVYGPYTFANYSTTNGFSLEDIMNSYSKALAQELETITRNNNVRFMEIAEPLLTENVPGNDTMEQEKTCIAQITKNLDIETNLSAPFNSMEPIWEKLLDFPVKGLTVDMRARDFFNVIPEPENIVDNHRFLFDHDIQKTLVLGCVNGRNGGFIPGKGLETPEWIAAVAGMIANKNNLGSIGITFSTDEVIVPRAIADKKLENIAKAKSMLGRLL